MLCLLCGVRIASGGKPRLASSIVQGDASQDLKMISALTEKGKTMREKLIEFLLHGKNECSKIYCRDCKYFALIGKCKENMQADSLIANDVLPVVRCKDCEHWNENQHGCVCSFHSQKENEDYPAFEVEMLPNDFCSYGERRKKK